DRQALVALYHATDGTSWNYSSNWDMDVPIAEWHGVEVNDQGRVVGLRLDHNNLQGQSTSQSSLLRGFAF
ncbi:unnamed protein product, partial [Hapterophycus canaliculatus]